MSEENEPDEDPQIHFMQIPIPPEVQQMMQAQADHAQMHRDEATHTLYRMLDEISIDHLRNIKLLLHNLGSEPQALGFWEGLITSKIAERTKTCVACGQNHDQMLEDMLNAEHAAVAATNDPTEVAEHARVAERAALWETYHVAPVLDDEPDGKVFCTGILPGSGPCGMVHPDLADRMVRKPDECTACHIRAGHG